MHRDLPTSASWVLGLNMFATPTHPLIMSWQLPKVNAQPTAVQLDYLFTDFKDFCYIKLETLIEIDKYDMLSEYNTPKLNIMK